MHVRQDVRVEFIVMRTSLHRSPHNSLLRAPLSSACADNAAFCVKIDGVNDRESDAVELSTLCRRFRLPAHVNLIPLNPTPGYPTVGSPLKRVHEFRDSLEARGVNATVRGNRGTDIDAACGQLAAGQPVTLTPMR